MRPGAERDFSTPWKKVFHTPEKIAADFPCRGKSLAGVIHRRGFAAGLFLLLLALAEVAARLWGPAMPSCATDRRNPYRFRGWPEYVAGARELIASNRVLVVLSNCQGYGAELPGRLGYPAALQDRLAEGAVRGDPDWKVVNWSLDGATSIEYVILAARLKELKPAAVVASLAYADFRAEHFNEGWRYSRSDVARLATRPATIRNLPRSFLRRHAQVEDSLALWAFDRVALLRAAEYGWSWLEARLPGSHYALYAPAINYRPWRLEGLAAWRPAIRPIGVPRDQDLDLAYDGRSAAMIDELAAALAAADVPAVLVAQPFRDASPGGDGFAADLATAAAKHGLPFWNLQAAIPPEEFLTSNHLTRRGHRALAGELAGRLATWLGSGETGDGR